MTTEELKRSQENYVQKVLKLSKEAAQSGANNLERYNALQNIYSGLLNTIYGLEQLRGYSVNRDLCSELEGIVKELRDCEAIVRTTYLLLLQNTENKYPEDAIGIMEREKAFSFKWSPDFPF